MKQVTVCGVGDAVNLCATTNGENYFTHGKICNSINVSVDVTMQQCYGAQLYALSLMNLT